MRVRPLYEKRRTRRSAIAEHTALAATSPTIIDSRSRDPQAGRDSARCPWVQALRAQRARDRRRRCVAVADHRAQTAAVCDADPEGVEAAGHAEHHVERGMLKARLVEPRGFRRDARELSVVAGVQASHPGGRDGFACATRTMQGDGVDGRTAVDHHERPSRRGTETHRTRAADVVDEPQTRQRAGIAGLDRRHQCDQLLRWQRDVRGRCHTRDDAGDVDGARSHAAS
jgi:hypothetical protein